MGFSTIDPQQIGMVARPPPQSVVEEALLLGSTESVKEEICTDVTFSKSIVIPVILTPCGSVRHLFVADLNRISKVHEVAPNVMSLTLLLVVEQPQENHNTRELSAVANYDVCPYLGSV